MKNLASPFSSRLRSRPARMARRVAAALAVASALGSSLPAAASSVQINYAGTLTSVSGSRLVDFFGSGGVPSVGAQFTGGFRFDLATPDTVAASSQAVFSGGNSLFYVDFGLDANGQARRFEQNLALPYNHAEVGNDISVAGSPQYDVWTAYGQLANNAGYEYVETGMVLLSFLLSSLGDDSFPTSLPSLAGFTNAGGCDPGGAGAALGLSCARDMEFHAKQNRGGDPYAIYDDVDIYGTINEMVLQRVNNVPEPGTVAVVLPALLGLAALRRKQGPGVS